jgi:hypothetical protein
MANPIPTIVFQVDLSNVQAQQYLNPDMHTESADLGRLNIANKATQHRILLNGLLAGNQYEVQHGGTLTEHGQKALYLLNTYGPTGQFPYLTVLSRSDVQS